MKKKPVTQDVDYEKNLIAQQEELRIEMQHCHQCQRETFPSKSLHLATHKTRREKAKS